MCVCAGSMRYWTANGQPLDDSRGMCTYYCPQPKTTAVEMTAYALLTFTEQNAVSFGLPIMKWLLSKQSKFGGYGSTQVERRGRSDVMTPVPI